MRRLNKNKQSIWYASYEGVEEQRDDENNIIGEKVIHSSVASALVNWRTTTIDGGAYDYGVSSYNTVVIQYNKALYPFGATTVFWIGKDPLPDENGKATVPYTHMADSDPKFSLNEALIYAKAVDVVDS